MSDLEAWIRRTDTGIEVEDDLDAINRLYVERGWSDGLPIVPPTVERVRRMLEFCDRAPSEPIASLAPRFGPATPYRLAINAVMAGCRPKHFPLLVTAIEALCTEAFNLFGVQTTTHQCAPLVIVNGPIARELEINAGHNAFGPGCLGNATIGRAIRLALVNIGGAMPGKGDMATFGSPAKYSYCVAENEAESPWEPLHVERGHAPTTSTVTVVAGESPHNVNDHESLDGEGMLAMMAGTMAITGANDVYYPAPQPVVVFGPEHARLVATRFSKAEVKQFLFEHATVPAGKFSPLNVKRRLSITFKDRSWEADSPVPVVQRPEDLIVVVIGGAGKHSAYIPTFGATKSVTVPVTLRDGTPAASVNDFRREKAA